jgi:hypothetical protein
MLKRIYTDAESFTLIPSTPFLKGSRVVTARQVNGYKLNPDMLYVSVRAISARINQNFDGFPSKELRRAAKTFVGRPVFVNHNNEDHRRTRGIILDAEYKESGNDKYIELFIEIDAKEFPRLASLISTGELDSVSMGTDVEFTKCSYCDNTAYEIQDFCDHVKYAKGQTLPRISKAGRHEDVLVYESCHGLNFFEISYVFDPADETAINQRVYLPSKHSKVASVQKRSLGEVTSPEAVDTLRDAQACPQCGNKDFNGKDCSLCEYVTPPEMMQDPDTMKSRVMQEVRKSSATGKEGRYMGNTTLGRMDTAIAKKRYEDAQARLAQARNLVADADTTTDAARESDSTDVTNIDQQFTSDEEARKADETTDVTSLPEGYRSSNNVIAQNRAAYFRSKRADISQDPNQDPTQDPTAGQDPAAAQAGEPPTSDGPNSGPPTSEDPSAQIAGLPIDWKQDESGQPYGTIQGTDLDIFVNEDLSWQVLPEGSQDPIAQGQGSDYLDAVQQALQQGQQISQQGGQDPSQQGDPSQDPNAQQAPPAAGDPTAQDPSQDPTKTSRRKKADGATPEGAKPDERTDVEKLPDYETITGDPNQYNPGDYDHNSFEQKAKPVDGSDVENFAPGGGSFKENNKSAARKLGTTKVFELVDAYTAFGLIPNTRTARTAAAGKFENLPLVVANDRLALLEQIANVRSASTSNGATYTRSTVPARGASKLPVMGKSASTESNSADADSLTLMTLR